MPTYACSILAGRLTPAQKTEIVRCITTVHHERPARRASGGSSSTQTLAEASVTKALRPADLPPRIANDFKSDH